ncbi:site-specific integrase [Paenibacillus sp. LK1]|uniref:tyrosine-type recombinase/integrase n=1 Tax=Paenibacillus sp. LK1 TaxID=2053014 RepID=UPI00211EC9AC|nr:site-specific integrase [Paenibacillus sp. LK1]
MAEEWFRVYSKGKVKKRSIITRRVEIKNLNKHFAKRKISGITHKDFQECLYQLFEQGYSFNTISGIKTTANMIFKYAIKNKYILDNPTTDSIIPVKMLTVAEIENKDQLVEEKYLDRVELINFFNVINVYGIYLDKEIFNLLAFSGFRSGELCALKWPDIDFEANHIRITKTLHAKSFIDYELTPPKTTSSIRVVPIDESIMLMLKELQQQSNNSYLQQKKLYKHYHDQNFVFRKPEGYPVHQKYILTRMQQLMKKTTIKKHATPNIFRHTYISMLAEAGVDLKTIMQRMGHRDEKITLGIYTHVTQKMQNNADQKLKKHFAEVLKMSVLQEL